ncbi:hypothetical protein PHLH4_33540 [Pseudomonas sp. St316]|nr:hypothetical protein PHLH4_33540 [Pseudomonas sp. St316]
MYIDVEHLADALDDRQAEALDIFVAHMAQAVELLEHFGQLFGGDAASLVVYHHALAPHADQQRDNDCQRQVARAEAHAIAQRDPEQRCVDRQGPFASLHHAKCDAGIVCSIVKRRRQKKCPGQRLMIMRRNTETKMNVQM